MVIYVLLYEVGKDNEGIHSLEINSKTIVLMFEEKDDAERYCGLLEAQDFPSPSVVDISREEIEAFCDQAGYESRFVQEDFLPQTDEERLSLVPPELNRDTTSLDDYTKDTDKDNLDEIRKRLEGLL